MQPLVSLLVIHPKRLGGNKRLQPQPGLTMLRKSSASVCPRARDGQSERLTRTRQTHRHTHTHRHVNYPNDPGEAAEDAAPSSANRPVDSTAAPAVREDTGRAPQNPPTLPTTPQYPALRQRGHAGPRGGTAGW